MARLDNSDNIFVAMASDIKAEQYLYNNIDINWNDPNSIKNAAKQFAVSKTENKLSSGINIFKDCYKKRIG